LIPLVKKRKSIEQKHSEKKADFFSKKTKNEQTCTNSTDADRPIREKHYFSTLNTRYSQNLMDYPSLTSTDNALTPLGSKVIVIQIQHKLLFIVNS